MCFLCKARQYFCVLRIRNQQSARLLQLATVWSPRDDRQRAVKSTEPRYARGSGSKSSFWCRKAVLSPAALHATPERQARFPFKRNRLRCVRCVNENRKKRVGAANDLRWQAANHCCHCFD